MPPSYPPATTSFTASYTRRGRAEDGETSRKRIHTGAPIKTRPIRISPANGRGGSPATSRSDQRLPPARDRPKFARPRGLLGWRFLTRFGRTAFARAWWREARLRGSGNRNIDTGVQSSILAGYAVPPITSTFRHKEAPCTFPPPGGIHPGVHFSLPSPSACWS
jgi:hypothetical protein